MGPCRAAPARLPRAVGGRRRPARRHRGPPAADPPGDVDGGPPVPRRPVRRVDLHAVLRAAAPAERPRRHAVHPRRLPRPGRPGRDRARRDHRDRPLRPHHADAAPRWPSTSPTLPGQRHRLGAARAPRRRSPGSPGSREFTAEVLPQNRKMIAVFSEAGYEVSRRFEDGVVSLTFDIQPTERVRGGRRCRASTAPRRSACSSVLLPGSIAVVGAEPPPRTRSATTSSANILDGRLHRRRPRRQPRGHGGAAGCRPTPAVADDPGRGRPRRRRRARRRGARRRRRLRRGRGQGPARRQRRLRRGGPEGGDACRPSCCAAARGVGHAGRSGPTRSA